jgi:hypothetical protein
MHTYRDRPIFKNYVSLQSDESKYRNLETSWMISNRNFGINKETISYYDSVHALGIL